jgi:hypothetical protein
MKNLLVALLISTSFVSCNDGTTVPNDGTYTPTYHYECQYVYDVWTNNYVYGCFWVFYSIDGSSSRELDMVADVADTQDIMLEKTAQIFSEKYSLSFDNGLKIAKNVLDLQSLKDRSADDLADFAKKLYGVNSSELILAVTKAQVGNNEALDELISVSAKKFNTDSDTMKNIIRDLHSRAIEASGIEL